MTVPGPGHVTVPGCISRDGIFDCCFSVNSGCMGYYLFPLGFSNLRTFVLYVMLYIDSSIVIPKLTMEYTIRNRFFYYRIIAFATIYYQIHPCYLVNSADFILRIVSEAKQ